MKTGPLFSKLITNKLRVIVCQGGGDAGKTITILQTLVVKHCMHEPRKVTTVTQRTIPAIKAGALRAFQDYVLPDFQKYIISYNATERTYTFYNGHKLEFKSYQDELAATGSERQNLFMNECNHEGYATFWQLMRKTRGQIYLDYNPTSPFWVHEKVAQYSYKDGKQNFAQERIFFGKVQMYIVDHRHNPFLTAEQHEMYETISDPDLFRVYSRGLTGKIKGLIFGHFKKLNSILLPVPTTPYRVCWGIDYGYTNDPTAIMKGVFTQRKRYWKEYAYKPGLPAEEIKNILVYQGGWKEGDDIFSEADPNMINQLINLGVPAQPAIKGPGSIAAGISKVKEHESWYTDDSLNLEKELSIYKWVTAEDVVTGKEIMTNQPLDAWNHCCDALRMADYTDSFRHRSVA